MERRLIHLHVPSRGQNNGRFSSTFQLLLVLAGESLHENREYLHVEQLPATIDKLDLLGKLRDSTTI